MVNVPGRSKGCMTCRKRKIKCDETSPACSQCVKSGLLCPGPRKGVFFVHALPASTARTALVKQTPRTSRACLDIKGRTDCGGCNYSSAHHLPSYQQPCPADIFDQLFVSHFIESFGFKGPGSSSQSQTWLDNLPKFLTSEPLVLVKSSIRASSMFFYGSLVDDHSIRVEATKWYLRALSALRNLLAQKSDTFSGDVVCSVVMLSHFESTAKTSSEAWFQHVQGAARMLQSDGPGSCCDGISHQIFRHLRLLVFTAAFFNNQQHVFSTQDWLTMPFSIHAKTAFDEFVDILLSLLPCLGVASEFLYSSAERSSYLRAMLAKLVHDLTVQLHFWWVKCFCSKDFVASDPSLRAEVSKDEFQLRPRGPGHFPLISYWDMPTASLAALFHAINVVVLRLGYLVSPDAHAQEKRIQQHVESILSVKAFIETFPSLTSSRGSVMVGLPLTIIKIWSPSYVMLHTRGSLQGHDGQDTGGTGPSTPSNGLFGDVASYVLHDHKPKTFA